MGDQYPGRQIARVLGGIRRRARVLGALLIMAFVLAEAGFGQCAGKSVVWMTERMAATHLLASRESIFPTEATQVPHSSPFQRAAPGTSKT